MVALTREQLPRGRPDPCPFTEDLSLLQQFSEFVDVQLAISEDFVKQAGADIFAEMRGYYRASAILMTEKVMASLMRTIENPPFPRAEIS
jgi:hypothetical protein